VGGGVGSGHVGWAGGVDRPYTVLLPKSKKKFNHQKNRFARETSAHQPAASISSMWQQQLSLFCVIALGANGCTGQVSTTDETVYAG
jgi:hypothetical protein